MTQLSDHFSLEELVRSEVAAAHGLDNTPPPEVVERLRALCVGLLEPLRVLVGRPVHVSSGYRCPELNRLVGGVPSSQHVLGEAADVEVPGITTRDLFSLVEGSSLVFDQAIEEFVLEGERETSWLHLSYRAGANRRQSFTLFPGKHR